MLYVNGRFVLEAEASLSPLDRGFTLADGLFETAVALGDRVFRMGDHLARMGRGAEVLYLALPSAEELTWVVLESIGRNGYPRSVVRLTVSRGVDFGRGLDAPPGHRAFRRGSGRAMAGSAGVSAAGPQVGTLGDSAQ